jgi:autotransporter-associated beta strand protein
MKTTSSLKSTNDSTSRISVFKIIRPFGNLIPLNFLHIFLFGFLVFLFGSSQVSQAQTRNYRGEINSWGTTALSNVSGNLWRGTISPASTDTSSNFKIDVNNWVNSWGTGGTVAFATKVTMFNNGDNSIFNATGGRHYTIAINAAVNANGNLMIQETANAPRTISSVSFDTNEGNGTVSVRITPSASLSSGEKIFVRRAKNDDWDNASFVEATGSGTSYTANLTHTSDSDVGSWKFYVMTTTVSSPNNTDADLCTLNLLNNSGSNYSYKVGPNVRFVSGTTPTTAFLGDSPSPTVEAWTTWNGNNRSWATVFIRKDNADLTSSASEGTGSNPGTSTNSFSAAMPRFTSTGTFYWAIRVSYSSGNDFWLSDDKTWHRAYDIQPKNARMVMTVSDIPAPSSLSATPTSTSNIDLTWTRGSTSSARDTLIFRSTSATPPSLTQGTAYNVNDVVSGSTCIFKGSATSTSSSGLTAGTQYYYHFFAINNDYYSPAATANATTNSAAVTLNAVTLGGGLTNEYGTASAGRAFTASGTNLSGSITATASSGYQVSTDNSSFSGSVSVSSGSNVFIRGAATRAAGSAYNTVTAATLSATGATAVNVTTSSSGNDVTKKQLTVTTNATSVTYGSPTSSITNAGGYTLSGFVNGETSAAGLTGSASYTTTYVQGDAAGTAGRTVTANVSGLSATNYSFGTPSAGTVTITAIGNITSPSITAGTDSMLNNNASWTRNGSFNTMVVRNTTGTFTAPTQGTSYALGATIGSDTVVYAAGSGNSFADTSGLAPGTTYYYRFYTENFSYYSTGADANRTTATAQFKNPGTANPSTAFLGDNVDINSQTWGALNGANGRSRAWISTTTNLEAGSAGSYTGYSSSDNRTSTTSRFSSVATWYYGVQIDYGGTYGTGFWYKSAAADWTALPNNGTGASLTITVSALNDPSGLTVTANGSTAIDLAWTRGTSGTAKDTVIVRRAGSAVATDPTQGTQYNANDTIGTGTVVYRGSGTTFTDTGLTQGTTYHYKIYSENWSYYSSGVTGSLSLSSDFIYNTTSDTTVSSILSGSANLTKTGSAELLLSGVNTYTGNTTISAGRLRIQADTGLGGVPGSARANSITLGSGTLALDGAFTLNANRGITLNNTGATIDDYGNADTYDGIISSSGTTSLTKAGGGTLTLGGVNTYTGATTISVGTLAITNASALGAGGTGNGTTVSSGAALTLSNGITVANELLTLNGTGSDTGALRNISGNNAWSAATTLAANARINSDAGTLTLGAVDAAGFEFYVGGSGNTTLGGALASTNSGRAIFKDGTGTLTLSATNTGLTGTILLRAGTLAAATNANLTSGTIQLGNGNTTATLSLTGGDTTRSQNITVTDSSTAGVINISTGTLTLTGTLGQTGSVNTTKIGKSGTGTLRLNSANTYEGQIQIGEGTVILANNTAHGVNTSTGARAIDLGLNVGDTSMANNVALYLVNGVSNNASIYIAPNTSSATRTVGLSGSGSATFLNDHFLDGNATLTGDSGTITFSGGFSSTGGLIATGGTVVLNKANTFTGATVVNGGTLRLDVGNALQSTASVTVNSGGTLTLNASGTVNNAAPVTLAGGTLRLSSAGETLGTLTVSANSVIDLAGTSNLTFASLVSIGAGNEIAIHNYTEGTDALIFTDATTAGANTTRFKIYSDAGTSLIADAYFDGTSLKPVPAPSAPTLGSASMPSNTTNITLNWTDLTGATAETSYEIQYSSASTFTSPTAVTGIAANSPSRTVDVGSTGTRYFRLRGVNSRGNGTWSTTQVIQLNSLAAGSTTYLSAAGTPGANTVAGIFGAANAAGLNDGANDSDSTNILLLSDSGSTAHTIFYSSNASGWREGSTDRASTAIPQGTAFMLRNRSSSTDFFLLAAAPRTENFTVSVNATAGQVNLLTPGRSTATALSALNLRPVGGNATNSIQTAAGAQAADVILIPQANGTFNRYHHDGTRWKSGLRDVPDDTAITVPPGGAFFIRKGPGSQFNTYHAPAE